MAKRILGLSMGAHDSSFAIFEDNELVLHEELERINRIKETNDCIITHLENFGYNLDEFDLILTYPHGDSSWYSPKYLQYRERNPQKCPLIGHHTSHAANAYFTSDFEESLVLTIDGGGWDDFGDSDLTLWEGVGNDLNLLHHSYHNPPELPNVGTLWASYLEHIYGLSKWGPPYGCQAGTVMAMAAFGDKEAIKNMEGVILYGGHAKGQERLFARENDENVTDEQLKFNMALYLQDASEKVVRDFLSKYFDKKPYKNICIAGGVALNCVMIAKLKEWFPSLENVYVPPVPYDAGLAIGVCQYYIHTTLKVPRKKYPLLQSPYLGRIYPNELIMETLIKNDCKYRQATDDEVVDLLIDQNIVSVYGGGSESGRRALGNRSILADPRSNEMKNLINEKVKHRQSFRPFAPSIIREEVTNWFVSDVDSPYMSFAVKFKDEVKDLVPAVVHADGTGRVQTVTEEGNKWYYNLIKKFGEKTNVPILLNTSFNDREPIVETPQDAVNCFSKTNIDYLYFRDCNILVYK